MVARGAGAAGPVLLACRQWDPLELARRLPCPGVGAWRSAPLLPWRVQCPVRVCAALAAGSGDSGRYLLLCLFCFPLPAPHVLRCVWRAILSGCHLPSLAATPFHAICAFRELGPVALLVVPVCPLRVCALALPRRPPPPPWVVWRVHLARSQHSALVGLFKVVRAPPRVLPRSLAPSGVLWGGAVWSRFLPTWLGLHALWGLRAAGVVGGRPRGGGGGAATVVRGVWCQALSLPLPPVFWGGRPGSRDPCVPGAVGAGVGTQHRPHSLRPCWPALLAVGRAEGRPQGGGLPPLRGASEVRRSPSPDCPPTRRAVGVRYPRAVGTGMWLWGPNTVPWACMPCGGCVPRGWWGAVPGGGVACHRCEGRLVSGTVPPPTARPLRRAAGVPRPVFSGCSRCGRGDPAPVPQRAPLRAGVARCQGGGRASRGKVPSTVVRGV